MSERAPEMSERTVGPAEIAGVFLKIGTMSYGGPAIMGIMQAGIPRIVQVGYASAS
jgi:hypothetical protein